MLSEYAGKFVEWLCDNEVGAFTLLPRYFHAAVTLLPRYCHADAVQMLRCCCAAAPMLMLPRCYSHARALGCSRYPARSGASCSLRPLELAVFAIR